MQDLALPVFAVFSCKVTSTQQMPKPPANPAPGACSSPESKPELLQSGYLQSGPAWQKSPGSGKEGFHFFPPP